MLDGEAFGAEMVQIVREFVAAQLDPVVAANKSLTEENAALAERVAALESREVPAPEQGEPGKDGEPGRDGTDCDMEVVKALVASEVAAAVAALPAAEKGDPGKDGADPDLAAIEQTIETKVREAVAAIPPARDGRDVADIEVTQNGAVVEFAFTVGEERSIFEVELPQGPEGEPGKRGEPGASGKLEIARAWTDEVHYEGQIRTHNGGAWQALRDTAKEPPHADWICLASCGADGRDGVGFNLRGLWKAEDEYQRLDVVALNGASFAAKSDNPGPCPGEGWQLFSQQGKRGQPGEKGAPGPRGEPGAPVVAAMIDAQGMQTLVNGDGTQVECDLYPVLASLGGR